MYPTHNLQIDPGQCILLIIDPQNDFHEGGSLAVPGSTAQAKKIAAMISEHKEKIGEIFITLDSHHKKHIAHHAFWSSIENDVNNKGVEPAADCSVEITEDDLLTGKWFPKDCSLQNYCLKYTRQLEHKGKFKLRIWPDHCLIGSDGHAIQEDIQRAVREWDIFHYHKTVKHIHKGMNCLTEMYSAIQAEVPIPSDPTTTRNEELLNAFVDCGRLIVCGQALSHCVKCTVEDIVEHWYQISGAGGLDRLYVLEDGSAPVPGCEASAKEFIEDMHEKGATVTTIAHAFDGWVSPAGEDNTGPSAAVAESSPLKTDISSRNLSNALHLLECDTD